MPTGAMGILPFQNNDSSLKAMKIGGVAPAEGAYPFLRPFYLLVPHEPSGALADFLTFLQSAEGKNVILFSQQEILP